MARQNRLGSNSPRHTRIPTRNYHLEATLDSGQAFRWRRIGQGWEGIIQGRWVRIESKPSALEVFWHGPKAFERELREYLQTEIDLDAIVSTFPEDPLMRQSVLAFPGLRVLRQDPWETLISFILSSAKQIPHIRDLVERLAQSYGAPVANRPELRAFPSAQSLATIGESELRGLRLGYRAKYVAAASRMVASGAVDLEGLKTLSMQEARDQLTSIPGVGIKIAHCVLLFAYDFPQAFPVDTWIRKTLEQGYPDRFPGPAARLEAQIHDYFGPYAGYAQQYLFHSIRTKAVVLRMSRPAPSHSSK